MTAIRISPEDSPFITRLCKDIRKISRMEPPVDLEYHGYHQVYPGYGPDETILNLRFRMFCQR